MSDVILVLFGILLMLIGVSLLGLVPGGVAVLSRIPLGYRRTAGFLEFVVAKAPRLTLDTTRLSHLVFAEFLFYAVLGFGFLVSFLGLSMGGYLPSFYGALSYSMSAVTALTVTCIVYAVGAGLLIVFLTDEKARSEYFGPESIAGMCVGLATFAIATRATLLMAMYPRTHHELPYRGGTDIPFGAVIDAIPLPILALEFALIAAIAVLVRLVETPVRVWHALLLVGTVAVLLSTVPLLVPIGPFDPIYAQVSLLLQRVQIFGGVALLLGGIEFKLESSGADTTRV
jgi:hypothetical protein